MKAKLLYPCGIPKPIALVMVGALLLAFCCTECLLAQTSSEDDPFKQEPIYCGCIKMVTCYGDAPEWPKPLIRLLESPVSLTDITASLMYRSNDERFDRIRYAEFFGSQHSEKYLSESAAKTALLLAQNEEVKESGNK